MTIRTTSGPMTPRLSIPPLLVTGIRRDLAGGSEVHLRLARRNDAVPLRRGWQRRCRACAHLHPDLMIMLIASWRARDILLSFAPSSRRRSEVASGARRMFVLNPWNTGITLEIFRAIAAPRRFRCVGFGPPESRTLLCWVIVVVGAGLFRSRRLGIIENQPELTRDQSPYYISVTVRDDSSRWMAGASLTSRRRAVHASQIITYRPGRPAAGQAAAGVE